MRGPANLRTRAGRHRLSAAPHEIRARIIERFISRWRKEVGNDLHPALRLIIPERDRERAMYGLKEKNIAKLIIRLMKIDKNSDDALNLLNWKLPEQNTKSSLAGDFARRCYEILSKRTLRTEPGSMSIADVNQLLDQMSSNQKEASHYLIMEKFYRDMNAEELMWLIRIILRQMKIGATEKTIFHMFHPDAELLYNISSNLRRVCWELSDPATRLEGEETQIHLMQCFQPQLAQFQIHSFEISVRKMHPKLDDDTFWIEEKLDGERIQLHMMNDSTHPGGKRFGFWSRKAKDYTYLYGDGLLDDNAALTQHLGDAFHENISNIILDGEMITWDPSVDKVVPYGTLKTAALSEQRNPHKGTDPRPLYRVFDILYLNDKPISRYTLRDRRRALQASVKNVHRRLEIHTYTEARSVPEIEQHLRKVIAEGSEGLVLKNPRSMYKLNERNDDWMKVKPEYMKEYGEALDCVIVGGYYGQGSRGGNLSSFLCGLPVNQDIIEKEQCDPMKCWSFFKVGGGFAASDYAAVRYHTEGKWRKWDQTRPPTNLIELAGGSRQIERPDMWIRADESLVISVKAASLIQSDSFRTQVSLRFPRFTSIRYDKDWKTALSLDGLVELKNAVEVDNTNKMFALDDARRVKRQKTNRKKTTLEPQGASVELATVTPIKSGTNKDLFHGLTLYVLTESLGNLSMSKAELEAWAKSRGANVVQSAKAEETICIGDRRTFSVAAIQKIGKKCVIRSDWLSDCARQADTDSNLGRIPFLLPFEPKHCISVGKEHQLMVDQGADSLSDSYAKDISGVAEMRKLINSIPNKFETNPLQTSEFLDNMEQDHLETSNPNRGHLFRRCAVYFLDLEQLGMGEPATYEHFELEMASNVIKFGNGRLALQLSDEEISHIIVPNGHGTATRNLPEVAYR